MSVPRLGLTAAGMALVGAALAVLTPTFGEMTGALAVPQRSIDTAGSDAVVIAAAGLLAWAVWAWGVLGLALTAASTLPGLLGAAAALATHVLLPAGARRSAGLLLGLGLGVAAPIAGVAGTVAVPATAAAAPASGVPDWPAAPAPLPAAAPTSVPDWPGESSPVQAQRSHVVVRGDCLWHIAGAHLLERTGMFPTDADTARAVDAWWTTNADVIGPDPDRLLPGQVLYPPEVT